MEFKKDTGRWIYKVESGKLDLEGRPKPLEDYSGRFVTEELAKEWYGAEESELDSEGLREGMYWNHFEMAYGVGSHYEVTKATYNELKEKRVFTEIYADEEVKYDRTPKAFEEDSDD